MRRIIISLLVPLEFLARAVFPQIQTALVIPSPTQWFPASWRSALDMAGGALLGSWPASRRLCGLTLRLEDWAEAHVCQPNMSRDLSIRCMCCHQVLA